MTMRKGAAQAAAPDLIIPVRPGEDNPELRYALRSMAANLPHRKVWIVGYVPTWLTGVEGIPLAPLKDQYDNMRQSLTVAVNHPGVADTFVLANDDFYVVQPVKSCPTYHRGPLREHIAWLHSIGKQQENRWFTAVRDTYGWLAERVEEPLSYETHTPLLMDRALFAQALKDFPADRTLAPSSLYAVAGAAGTGERQDCVKQELSEWRRREIPLLSSSDRGFRGATGDFIRKLFTEKCRYER